MEVRIQTRNEELANGISQALRVIFCLQNDWFKEF